MTALAVTAITNFLLACEAFFLAGLLVHRRSARFSAAWFWGGMMTLLGLSALLGGIDHGFFEAEGLPRYGIQRSNWLVIGGVTFFLLMTTAMQFFGRRARKILTIAGIVQGVVYAGAVLAIEDFAVVIVNYVPVLVLMLVMNVVGLKNRTGSWPMIAGIVILFVASAIQAAGVDVFDPLRASGLYHVVSMVALVFLYRGGLRLRTVR